MTWEEFVNFTQGLRRAWQTKPHEVALLTEAGGLSWAHLGERVARFAGALRRLGLKAGDAVAVLSLNSDRYFELYMSVPWAGGVIVPLNYRWTVEENQFALKDCEARFLVVDDAYLSTAQALSKTIDGLIVVHAGVLKTPADMFSYENVLAESSVVADAMRRYGDLACIFYTGGTTGRSKGVMLSHGNITTSALHALAEGVLPPEAIYLSAAPMFHLGNGTMMFPAMVAGRRNAVLRRFGPRDLSESIARNRVTHTLLVPTMIQSFVDDPCLDEFDLSSLRQITYGAAPVSETLLERAMARLPQTQFVQLYGMTELSPIATILPHEQHVGEAKARGRTKSAGRAIIGVDVRVVDEKGEEMPRGEIGEIVVLGDTVMMGYRNLPDQTAAAVQDGWMHTGDAGYMDEEGYIYVVDRIKDMIITGGENVYSSEVENVLAQHPAVQACAIIGVPDNRWGESVHAVVVSHARQSPSAESLIEFCRRSIAPYKCPRSIEFRSDPLPTTAAGKVDKPALRREHAARQ
jgi:long-chain acyl-CoA synthetase